MHWYPDPQMMFLSKALHRAAFSSISQREGDFKRGEGDSAKAIHFFTTCPEPWGGSEELWSGAAQRLASDGFQVSANLDFLDQTHPRVVQLAKSGVQVERYRGVPGLWRIPGLSRRWERPLTIAHLHAKKPQLAVISQGENFDGQRQILHCRAAAIPYVIICQKAMDDRCPLDARRDNLRLSFSNAERIFFVSQHNRQVTEERLGCHFENAEVVWNPFNVDYRSDLAWPAATDGVFRLACVARLWMRDKGQDILVKVLAQEKWRKRAIEVRLYGSGHNEVGIKEMAEMLGTDQVKICGFSEDVTDVWRQCHALVLPSRHEGLPLALVEAMLCARPSIVTDAGGNAEVLEDEVNGFIAHSATVAGVDEAMERAWNRRGEWQEMGATAARLIRNKIPQDPCAVFADRLKAIHRDVSRAR